MADTYNGYTNFETWLVALWLDEYGEEDYWRERAQEAVDNADSEPFSGPERFFADDLKDWIVDEVENAKLSGLLADLLNAAVSRVNWYEIAKLKTDALQEETA